jgi:hypothetical protein
MQRPVSYELRLYKNAMAATSAFPLIANK